MKKNINIYKKPVQVSLSILAISKIAMCGIWYDYIKLKFGEVKNYVK